MDAFSPPVVLLFGKGGDGLPPSEGVQDPRLPRPKRVRSPLFPS